MTEFSLRRNGYKRSGDTWVKDVIFEYGHVLRVKQLVYHPSTNSLRSRTKRQMNNDSNNTSTAIAASQANSQQSCTAPAVNK